MKTRRVKAGAVYQYKPVLFDVVNPPFGVSPGDLVRVVNLPGCPRANTMGMCHVEKQALPNKWVFSGMVCTNSLQPRKDKK